MRTLHKWTLPLLVAGLLAVTVASAGRADDDKKPAAAAPDRNAIDAALNKSLRDVINRGADLYNRGDTAGAYRLFQGALLAVRPLLDHRPEVQQAIADALAQAERIPLPYERAFVLRTALDKVRASLKPETKTTLWDRLGGEANVRKVVNDFVATAAPDPKVDFFRDGKFKLDAAGVNKLKQLLVEPISSVSGGPLKYTGRDMKSVHKGMGITDAQFNALAGHLKNALEKNGAKPDDAKAVLDVVGSLRSQIVEPKAEKAPPPKEEDK